MYTETAALYDAIYDRIPWNRTATAPLSRRATRHLSDAGSPKGFIMSTGIKLSIFMALAASVISFATAGTASAKNGNGDGGGDDGGGGGGGGRPLGRPVSTAGTCSDGTTTFTLKSMFDDDPFPQTVGAEFEVDSGIIGQAWEVTLTDNGVIFFDSIVETIGPEGAVTVTQPDQGAFNIAHKIVARAVNQTTGAVCTGTVTDQPLSGR